MACPDGLERGFGLSAREATALCLTKSYFGIIDGEGIYISGSALLFAEGRMRYVVTAAHNLYHAGQFAKWCDVWFKRDGDMSLASRQTTKLFVPDEFQMHLSAEWDFGIARLKSSVGSDRFTPLTLGVADPIGDTRFRLCGYPNEYDCVSKHKPYYADLTATSTGTQTFCYQDQQTYEGQSGGALLHKDNSGIVRSYGVHTRGGTGARAVRFTEAVLQRILSWT